MTLVVLSQLLPAAAACLQHYTSAWLADQLWASLASDFAAVC